MKAALITTFGQPPQYGEHPDPTPSNANEMLVDVLAVGLHHVTRGRASGAHYSSTGTLPLIAGIDGVGRGTDGKLRYFAQGPGQIGTMADKTVIELDHSIVLPDDCAPIALAGAMNPAMASWLALRCRASFQPGQKVLILGATGSSGSLAVQIARHLGATQVIAVGRDERKLAKLLELGATEVVSLGDARLGERARDVDIVLDFIWGESVAPIMEQILKQRSNRSQELKWIQIGSMAGETATIPGAFLRSSNLQIMGSGLGSVSGREILVELPALAAEIARGTFSIDILELPLSMVKLAWIKTDFSSSRIVFIP